MERMVLRTFFFILATTLLAYIFFFVFSIFSYPGDQLHHQFRVAWIFQEALRSLIEYYPSIITAAVIASFATIGGSRGAGGLTMDDFTDPLGKLMLVLILFTFLFSALAIGLGPRLHSNKYNQLHLSSLAKEYLGKARTAEEEKRYGEALRYYDNYLSIINSDRRVENARERVAGRAAAGGEENTTQRDEEPMVKKSEYRNMTAAELIERSRKSLNKEDPFTAHYLARLALELEPGREDAKRLAARAWELITEAEPSRSERKAHQLYQEKVRGYRALQEDRPVEAYYIFKKLSAEKPNDSDIEEYLEESRIEARKVSYFIEEARKTDSLPGIRTVVYVEPPADTASGEEAGNTGGAVADGERTHLIYIDKMVRRGTNAWLHDFEMISFGGEGEPVRRLHSEYAKLSTRISPEGPPSSVLIFRGIDRDDRTHRINPTVHYAGGNEPSGEESGLVNVRSTPVAVHDLTHMSMHRNFMDRINLIELFRLGERFEQYGHPPIYVHLSTLMRLLDPFLVLILSLFAVGFGLRFRPRSGQTPKALLPFLIVLPFALQRIVSIYEYGHRLVFTGILRTGGFSISLISFLILQALLLFFAIYFIARYRET